MVARITAFLGSPFGRVLRCTLSLALIGWLVWNTDWRAFAALEGSFSWPLALGAFMAAALAYPLCAIRWRGLLASQNVNLSFRRAHDVVWIGQFYNAFLPGGVGGDAARLTHAFAEAPDRKAGIAAATLADRIVGFGTLLAFALPLGWLAGRQAGSNFASLLWLVGAVTIAVPAGFFALRWFPAWLPADWNDAVRRMGRDVRAAGIAMALSAVVWLLDFLSGWLLAESLGLDLPFSHVCLALIVAYLSTILPVTIGGHGLRESALMMTLAALNSEHTRHHFTALALLFFAVNLLCSLLGGIALLTHQARRRAG
jgi:glycosyltransferase 2 family protein